MMAQGISVALLACALAGPAALGAQATIDAPVTRGLLAFDAHATLGAFTGTTTTVTGAMTGAASLGGVRGWVAAPAASLTTNNGHRDHDMAGSLEPAKYPTLRFDLDSVATGGTASDSVEVTLHGRLTLHGQTRSVRIPGWAWITPAGARFRGAVPINVKDYGVGGLSKMLGLLKMDERILVRIDVTFGE
jgi:polyisoprenoid-binding protein YceI